MHDINVAAFACAILLVALAGWRAMVAVVAAAAVAGTALTLVAVVCTALTLVAVAFQYIFIILRDQPISRHQKRDNRS